MWLHSVHHLPFLHHFIYINLAKSSCLVVLFQEMVAILVLLTYLLLSLKLSLDWRHCCYNVQGSRAAWKQRTRFSLSEYCHNPMVQIYMGLNQTKILLKILMAGTCFVYSGFNSSFILYFDFRHNSRAAASRHESTGHYEEPISSTENNYAMEPMKKKTCEEINTKKNEYECVGNTQESEYEVGDTV